MPPQQTEVEGARPPHGSNWNLDHLHPGSPVNRAGERPTPGDDVIPGIVGDAQIDALAGNDVICVLQRCRSARRILSTLTLCRAGQLVEPLLLLCTY